MVLGKAGDAGLTHRAVAAEAGVSVGAVSHHYPTANDLMLGAYRALVDNRTAAAKVILKSDSAAFSADYPQMLISFAISDMTKTEALAIDELMMAMAADPAAAGLASRIRYERGDSSYAFLTRLDDYCGKITALDGALLSTWMKGLRRSIMLLPLEERRARAERAIALYLELMAPSQGASSNRK